MKKHIIWIGTVLMLISAFCSCGKKQHIKINKEQLVFNSFGGTDLVRIVSDCNWNIELEGNSEWLVVYPLQGVKDTTNITVTVTPNEHNYNRNTRFSVVSENGKNRQNITVSQEKININYITSGDKIWFLRDYERWDSDFYNVVIPESYRSWTYYTDEGKEFWLFYFMENNTGYEIRIKGNDTIYYPYDYHYYPEGDSLYILFQTVDETIEDYHATIHELNNERFTISDAYRPHQYEKLYMLNVTNPTRGELKVNPKKVMKKPSGPLIELK